jgi:hypothetical protein
MQNAFETTILNHTAAKHQNIRRSYQSIKARAERCAQDIRLQFLAVSA